ncbi:hypothetical protein RFF05_17635 [Bengtsoniella intestinalis]|uniref:hypothetical protein n=1 Tax=Bengtsoniella intestinalis TaxID=3073143 RepID=UPI00391EF576
MNSISYFFIAAAVGFVVMAAITAQAIEALFTTPILIRNAFVKDPDFQVATARMRSRQVAILLTIPSIIICAIITIFLSDSLLWGYWFGFVVALVVSYQRFQPNRVENQEKFKQSYIDCFSDFQPPVVETPAVEEDDHSDGDDDKDDLDVVPVSRPR